MLPKSKGGCERETEAKAPRREINKYILPENLHSIKGRATPLKVKYTFPSQVIPHPIISDVAYRGA